MGELVPPPIVGLYTEGADTAELHEDLVVGAGGVILNEPRYGVFLGTDLDLVLRSRGVDTVIITGIATNICCETTAREAAQRDYRVLFLSDATATNDRGGVPAEDLQRAACASLSIVFAQVITTEELMQKIRVAGYGAVAETPSLGPTRLPAAALAAGA